MNTFFFRSALLPGLIVALVGSGFSRPAHAEIDPFYVSRERDGEQALARGDYAQAAQDLRIAAFGMLDQPPRLAATLTELAIAETGVGADDDFWQTLQRLQDLEDRFSAYSKAPLTDVQRESFETSVMQRLSEKELQSLGIFAHLIDQKVDAELALLPVRQRRRSLQQRIDSHPDEARWGLELAQLESTDGHPRAALEALDQVLAEHPDLDEALCKRGSLNADQKNWGQAAEDLSACTTSATDPALARQRLEALIANGRISDAQAFASTLSDSISSDPEVSQTLAVLSSTTEEDESTEQGPETAIESSGAQSQQAAPEETPSVTAPAQPTLTLPEQSSLESAHTLLQSRNANDLTRALVLVAPVASDHPDDREVQLLAAEIAYRLSRWNLAVGYFEQAGGPDETQYALRFYYAVSLFEAGQRDAAARELAECLPHLQRTPFVESYRARILGPDEAPNQP